MVRRERAREIGVASGNRQQLNAGPLQLGREVVWCLELSEPSLDRDLPDRDRADDGVHALGPKGRQRFLADAAHFATHPPVI
jgi:hypothetical protein